jgi:hypothetical protein
LGVNGTWGGDPMKLLGPSLQQVEPVCQDHVSNFFESFPATKQDAWAITLDGPGVSEIGDRRFKGGLAPPVFVSGDELIINPTSL